METIFSYLEKITESPKLRFLEIPLIIMLLLDDNSFTHEVLKET